MKADKNLSNLIWIVVVVLTCWDSNCSAQQISRFSIDSTSIINGQVCSVMNIYFEGELHETQWFFGENGYVRQYAYITYGMGSDTLDWDEFYFVKQFPQIGDTWLAFIAGPAMAEVTDTVTLSVPAGTFQTYKIEYRDSQTSELRHVSYAAEGVGGIAMEHQGAYGVLTSDTIVGGNGCFPIAVGNVWNYSEDTLGIASPHPFYSLNDFSLKAAFPNPFNPSTVLSFELPTASYVTLEVFDINGRSVGARHAVPANETWYLAGPHQVTFDGADLPSGLYFAKLTAGDFSQVQKLVLLK